MVVGAGGQLGLELIAKISENKIDCCAYTHSELDITNKTTIEEAFLKCAPDYVINVAAYTSVDYAEIESDLAFAVNRDGAANLAMVCNDNKSPLIHISTDYVFDGKKEGTYLEDDLAKPVNVYGQSKYEGEEAIKTLCIQHVILRTSWVFSGVGKNFVNTMLELSKKHEELSIVADQSGGPTPASAIAEAILSILSTIDNSADSLWGTYHLAGMPYVTWFEFAQEIFSQARYEQGMKIPTLKPVSSDDYPLTAIRPKNSRLNCNKINRVFNIEQPQWKNKLFE